MISKTSLFYLILSISFNFFSQNKFFVATARLNKNVMTYTKQISTDIEFIDFMGVNLEERDSLLQKCSGLLLLGGLDINPTWFNKKELANYCEIDATRDSIEFDLLKWADSSSIPIFGICRGMQIINVYFGGTLCVDIPSLCEPSFEKENHRDSKRKKDVFHKVAISENTKLSGCFEDKNILVNSFHHQSIGELGKTLKISAKSPGGIIEGIENDGSQQKSFVLGVQWHPERYYNQVPENLNLLREFFKEVRSRN